MTGAHTKPSVTRNSHRSRGDGGFVLILFVISMLGLLLMIGFAVDVGSWYLRALQLQRAADAAALAGAIALPDSEQALLDSDASFHRNGFNNNTDGISITHEAQPTRFSATVVDNKVPTYFLSVVKPNITITRKSTARRGSVSPALGSPYNVLGSGDLTIDGIPKQFFWLAVNGACSPKEDGDYFGARYDANKGPFTNAVDANGNYIPDPTSKHTCPSTNVNPDYSPAGYSYSVDIPPAKPNGTVAIKVFHPTYFDLGATPDQKISLPQDKWPAIATAFHIWDDSNDTPDNPTDDTLVSPTIVDTGANPAASVNGWLTLYEVPYAKIVDGHHYRVQVYSLNYDDPAIVHWHGVNSFAIGAFRSWGSTPGCDSRTIVDCPRVSGRSAISVYNNLVPSGSDNTVSYYFAEIDKSYIGQAFNMYLWDPGEGTQKIEVLGPDGTPLTFDWTTTPSSVGYAGTNVTSIDTSGTGPSTVPGPYMSNNAKFNDRLVTLRVTLPMAYKDMVAAADGDQWLRVRYTIGSAPKDRTTWGISMDGNSASPAKLVRPGT